MYFAICHLSVVPVRASNSDKSELVTQLLFGEVVEVIERKGSWWYIRCTWDNYLGWIDEKQVILITPSEAEQYHSNFAYCLELVQPIIGKDHYIPITVGSRLPHFDGMRLTLQENSYQFTGQAVFPNDLKPSMELLQKIARKYLYAPYLWGGRSPLGIDCSGFTQNVYKMVGYQLPRDAAEQVMEGELIDFVEQAKAGDLAFFENKAGRITHVGILCEDQQIIHASGQVRIDKIDHYGIFNADLGKYTHRLRVTKRMLPAAFYEHLKPIVKEERVNNQVKLF